MTARAEFTRWIPMAEFVKLCETAHVDHVDFFLKQALWNRRFNAADTM
jgi:hypothetical protein